MQHVAPDETWPGRTEAKKVIIAKRVRKSRRRPASQMREGEGRQEGDARARKREGMHFRTWPYNPDVYNRKTAYLNKEQ